MRDRCVVDSSCKWARDPNMDIFLLSLFVIDVCMFSGTGAGRLALLELYTNQHALECPWNCSVQRHVGQNILFLVPRFELLHQVCVHVEVWIEPM